MFYFRPGHECFPIYYDANVQRVISNAVLYLAPADQTPVLLTNRQIVASLNDIDSIHTFNASLHQHLSSIRPSDV